ncbi:DUF2169 domain-containing protein [Pendulispora brunnea]|uniref:DUF2169 domain-containing protein n=1 Tax=Pendulispora brunnea TaxID=2905690 RepID=A0ABZ2JZB8_9BACT
MNFVNNTPWQARFHFGSAGQEVNVASVVARATFQLVSPTMLVPANDPWPVFAAPIHTIFGTFPADSSPNRVGCDLIALGTATSRTPVTWLNARVRAGNFASEILVVGDRVWTKRGGTLAASAPRAFTEMPINWSRALGGTLLQDGQSVPDPLNPEGRGAYLTEMDAVDNPLPNLMDPCQPISSWDDRLLPVAWGPISNAPAWQMAAWLMERNRLRRPSPTEAECFQRAAECFMCAAPPRNLMQRLEIDDPVSIEFGDTVASFRVPRLALALDAEIGTERVTYPLTFSGLWILLDAKLVIFTLQTVFRYALRPYDVRTAILRETSPAINGG